MRDQGAHVEREAHPLQVRKVVAESPPTPRKAFGTHPAVDLRKQRGAVSEKRGCAQSAITYDLGRDALGEPSLEEDKPLFGRPGKDQIAVRMKVDEARRYD